MPSCASCSRSRASGRSCRKPGLIIRAVGQQFPAPEPDEEIEILALDALGGGAARGFRERGMRDAERRRVAAQRRQPIEQRLVGRARQAARRAACIPGRARHRPPRGRRHSDAARCRDRDAARCDRRRSPPRRRARAPQECAPSWIPKVGKCQFFGQARRRRRRHELLRRGPYRAWTFFFVIPIQLQEFAPAARRRVNSSRL